MTARPSWPTYFLAIARQVATRGTCPRLQVGCVIVRDKHILASGYNGSAAGLDHCGCDVRDGHCTTAVHSEANALIQAAKHGTRVDKAAIYCTHLPCWHCFLLLANAGIQSITYAEDYGDIGRTAKAAKELGIYLVRA